MAFSERRYADQFLRLSQWPKYLGLMAYSYSLKKWLVQSQILGHPARHGSYRLEENGMTLNITQGSPIYPASMKLSIYWNSGAVPIAKAVFLILPFKKYHAAVPGYGLRPKWGCETWILTCSDIIHRILKNTQADGRTGFCIPSLTFHPFLGSCPVGMIGPVMIGLRVGH